jgi:CheY-like chemotaxis protein
VPSSDPVPERAVHFIPPGSTLYRAVGCPECAMTGYRGRFCIVEVLTVNPEIERHIGQGATADQIARDARANGMGSLWESGLRHVLTGESTLDELLRVTDVPAEAAGARPRREPPPQQPPAPPPAAAAAAGGNGALLDFSAAFELVDEVADGAGPAVAPPARGTCVLLVEDEDQLRRVMKDLLEREGYTVAEARDGVHALDQVDRFAPDIIVLDLNLPGLDGYSVLSQLRSRPATRGIPVVVLTAKGDEDNEVRVFQLGADDFITKPFRAKALSARLEAVLGRHRA